MLDIASAFRPAPGYLDTPSYGRPARATATALRRAVRAWEHGTLDPVALDGSVARMRAAYATLVGAQAEDVALAGSTSQVVGMVAASLPDGARVVVADGDFSSVCLPFLADPRLEVVVVPLARIVAETRRGADLVAVSAVQSADGAVLDLDALAAAASASGTRTLVDASHSAGWMPMRARDFDVTVTSTYKWLGTPRGIALAAVRPEADWVRPVGASWYGSDAPWDSLYGPDVALSATARRLDTSPPWQLVEAGAVALELLVRQGVEEIGRHSVGLANDFRALVGLPAGDSPIVSVAGVDPRALSRAGIRAAARGGRARLGFYVYNDAKDVETAASAIRVAQAA
ncbi:aminotransferase class V-fold PLP-dependent enzyme [Demequina mangrovi]|uniref:Selenocysteine lyase/Cysteine desulfurase n=1 Tax=Demequina mangrovi TaxID=1043493 RepID=A0A1H6VZZ7_9MICO|nr:aminotransferase class V-fold PLP-dependent enzyme [Demequina mangrovi]SEJ09296.1 Selenocysteine lyase/Cysteine desulfurase [Demequina mangrovi]